MGYDRARYWQRLLILGRDDRGLVIPPSMAPLKIQLNLGRAVVLVGAAHLPGREGILALLAKSGYRIREVRSPVEDSRITPASASAGDR